MYKTHGLGHDIPVHKSDRQLAHALAQLRCLESLASIAQRSEPLASQTVLAPNDEKIRQLAGCPDEYRKFWFGQRYQHWDNERPSFGVAHQRLLCDSIPKYRVVGPDLRTFPPCGRGGGLPHLTSCGKKLRSNIKRDSISSLLVPRASP